MSRGAYHVTYPVMHVMYLPPPLPHEMRDACENITFPATSFADSKKEMVVFS